jgi:hypothetical protein
MAEARAIAREKHRNIEYKVSSTDCYNFAY